MMSEAEIQSGAAFAREAPALINLLAEGLAFVSPGLDAGLLDLNAVATDLEDLIITLAPGPWADGVAVLRGWINDVVQGDAVFTAPLINQLGHWHTWVTDLIEALEDGEPLPALPLDWEAGGEPTYEHPSSADSDRLIARDHDPESEHTPASEGSEITLDMGADEELLAEFYSESLDLLADIEQGVLKLEENPSEAGTIDTIFRAFHTFKGGASILRMEPVAAVAHELETLLDAIRKKQLVINRSIIDVILEGADFLAGFSTAIGARLQDRSIAPTFAVETDAIIDLARNAVAGELPEPSAMLPEGQATSLPSVAMVGTALVDLGQNDIGSILPSVIVAPPSPVSSPVIALTPEPKPRASAVTAPKPERTDAAERQDFQVKNVVGSVKVDTEKLDSLVNLVGELIIAQSMVVEDPAVVGLSSLGLSRSLRELGRVTGELQRNAMSLRMVPIGGVFQKMGRLVRDLSMSQHKSVQLLLEGEDVELDRNIVDKIGDPLVHLVRNAVDHGIEPPEERSALGKRENGTVRLSAIHRRGGICIRIEDDGRGLNADRIYAKAVDLGIIPAAASLTETEIFNLIFLPGMSTAAVVTDVSGRGVGMDVVRENIQTLRGQIEIESKRGVGTVFTILLPLTLAIIDGLLVGAGEDRYIIPTLSVRESFKPTPDMLSSVHGRSEMIRVRGQQVPLIRLNRCLGTESEATSAADGIVLVLEAGDAIRALQVDHLFGKQEVVIKNIGKIFERQVLVSGGAILADGRVGLLLDVEKLIKMNF